jgi:hypothetical protein
MAVLSYSYYGIMLKESKIRSIFVNRTIRFQSVVTLADQMSNIEKIKEDRDGLPPFVKSWRQLYQLLILTLLLLIAFFYLFMKNFS